MNLVNSCVNYIIMLKFIVLLYGEVFPFELIFKIVSIIWHIKSDPRLNICLCDHNPSTNLWCSTLILGDVIDIISYWTQRKTYTKVHVLRSGAAIYHFYIDFGKQITLDNKLSGIIIDVNTGRIRDSLFSVNIVNKNHLINSNSMFVSLDVHWILNINTDIYRMINKLQRELCKYYLKFERNSIKWYRFDSSIHKHSLPSTKEAKSQIVILLLKYFWKQLMKRGFYIENHDQRVYQPLTIDKILSYGMYELIY